MVCFPSKHFMFVQLSQCLQLRGRCSPVDISGSATTANFTLKTATIRNTYNSRAACFSSAPKVVSEVRHTPGVWPDAWWSCHITRGLSVCGFSCHSAIWCELCDSRSTSQNSLGGWASMCKHFACSKIQNGGYQEIQSTRHIVSQEPFENRCLSTVPLQVPAVEGDLTWVCL